MTAKHTSGMWKLKIERNSCLVLDDEDRILARVPLEPGMSDDESVANGRLMAASPALLAACDIWNACRFTRIDNGSFATVSMPRADFDRMHDAVEAAIAQARNP